MRIKKFPLCLSMFIASFPLLGAPPASSTVRFDISNPAQIPGATLVPGSYSIHIVNKLSDRLILSVDSANGNLHTTFLGIPERDMDQAGSGPVKWPHVVDGATYLKGWHFSGSPRAVEFVYPKSAAVAIAKVNPAKVPAIDPASEGKPTDNTLSKSDMQLITLWMLSLEQVGSGEHPPGIKAERYEQTASVNHKPVISALPHTASWMPLVWLVGFCSLIVATILRIFRLHIPTKQDVPIPSPQS
jgi:hypothetical protein